MAKAKKQAAEAEAPVDQPVDETPADTGAAAEAAVEGEAAEGTGRKEKKKRFPRKGFQADGKKIRSARTKIDKTKRYELADALNLLFESAPKRKFDETVELVMKLGIDPRKQGQAIRGAFAFPKGVGSTKRVIAFVEGPAADEAKNAGAVAVGGEDLAQRITEGWDDFDVAIAHPAAMKFVGKLGKILGPKGKMPAPKAGTVTPDVATAVAEFSAGKVEFRADDHGNVHVPVGKRSFSKDDLVENITAFVEYIKSVKPTDSKGQYIQKVVLSSTMGPGIPVDVKAS